MLFFVIQYGLILLYMHFTIANIIVMQTFDIAKSLLSVHYY